jgi:hypothetical protein
MARGGLTGFNKLDVSDCDEAGGSWGRSSTFKFTIVVALTFGRYFLVWECQHLAGSWRLIEGWGD